VKIFKYNYIFVQTVIII